MIVDSENNICIFIEQRKGIVEKISFEVLRAGLDLASKLNATISCLVLGRNKDGYIDEILKRGGRKVYLVESEILDDFLDETYVRVIEYFLLSVTHPILFLGGATIIGKSLFPRLSARMKKGLLPDCMAIEYDDSTNSFVGTRSVYAGNALAKVVLPLSHPTFATIRPKVWDMAERKNDEGEIVRVEIPSEIFSSNRMRVIESVSEKGDGVSLTEADIIVSGGRGLRGPENFYLIRELADAVGGAVGASRAVVDAGWIPYSHQVGQTGKTVNPKLYIACGISGAIQHLAGMRNSKCIVAINRDSDAPIFKIATYGIIGDLFEILPALTKKLKEIKR